MNLFKEGSAFMHGKMVYIDASGFTATWRILPSKSAGYLRESLEIAAGKQDLDLAKVTLIDVDAPGASVRGTVPGSPIATDTEFFGFEHPMSQKLGRRWTRSKLDREKDPGKSRTDGNLFGGHRILGAGVNCDGPFQRYIEDERARRFKPFLHYNCWYDLGWSEKYNQAECLNRIDYFGNELTEKRGVRLSSFLFDDGWDDTNTTWNFDKGFPNCFRPLAAEAARFGSAPGIWLSPWGGYGDRREQRLAAARSAGYEVDSQGLAPLRPKVLRPIPHRLS